MDNEPEFKRILIKLSGEALMGNQGFGITPEMIHYVAGEIAKVARLNVEVSIVVGGGNIFRGVAGSSAGMDRSSADHMGMLATVINSLALCDALEKCDVPTRVQTAIRMDQVAEPFIRRKAIRHLEKGRVVILRQVRAIRILRLIRQPCSGPMKSALRYCSRPRRWMAYMTKTQWLMMMQ